MTKHLAQFTATLLCCPTSHCARALTVQYLLLCVKNWDVLDSVSLSSSGRESWQQLSSCQKIGGLYLYDERKKKKKKLTFWSCWTDTDLKRKLQNLKLWNNSMHCLKLQSTHCIDKVKQALTNMSSHYKRSLLLLVSAIVQLMMGYGAWAFCFCRETTDEKES